MYGMNLGVPKFQDDQEQEEELERRLIWMLMVSEDADV